METNAVIRGIIPFDINDEPYFTIYFAHESDPDTILEARLPAHEVYPHPHVNDRVRVHYVLKIPTRIEKTRT